MGPRRLASSLLGAAGAAALCLAPAALADGPRINEAGGPAFPERAYTLHVPREARPRSHRRQRARERRGGRGPRAPVRRGGGRGRVRDRARDRRQRKHGRQPDRGSDAGGPRIRRSPLAGTGARRSDLQPRGRRRAAAHERRRGDHRSDLLRAEARTLHTRSGRTRCGGADARRGRDHRRLRRPAFRRRRHRQRHFARGRRRAGQGGGRARLRRRAPVQGIRPEGARGARDRRRVRRRRQASGAGADLRALWGHSRQRLPSSLPIRRGSPARH